jgi:hypothetical protein
LSESTVLLVGGRLTSGKDAFADHLVATQGYVKLGMSDVLAEALYILNPWIKIVPSWLQEHDFILAHEISTEMWQYQSIVDSIGYVEAKTIPEVRTLLQRLGTEVGRNLLGQNIWVDAVRKKIENLALEGKNVVVTGIRFPNELHLENVWEGAGPFQKHFITAASIWVERPSLPALDPDPSKRHASEGSVKAEDFEYVLMNDGTLEDLYGAAGQLLDSIAADYA